LMHRHYSQDLSPLAEEICRCVQASGIPIPEASKKLFVPLTSGLQGVRLSSATGGLDPSTIRPFDKLRVVSNVEP